MRVLGGRVGREDNHAPVYLPSLSSVLPLHLTLTTNITITTTTTTTHHHQSPTRTHERLSHRPAGTVAKLPLLHIPSHPWPVACLPYHLQVPCPGLPPRFD